MLNKENFWELIDEARESTSSIYEIPQYLIDKLSDYDLEDVYRFDNILGAYLKAAYKGKLWAAAYVINGGCSDDGFDYFRPYILALGKDVLLMALEDPDDLSSLDMDLEDGSLEDMLSVGSSVYQRKNGEVGDYMEYSLEKKKRALSLEENEEIFGEIKYDYDINRMWDEENVCSLVPRLCAKYNY